ncbi:glycosyltransferase family 39 protein [Kocuria sp. CPCC 205292]|uniref:glycosyltransferase family 39 protein n=1 Tax=Kocuria cellulosilytica TaxID=3071451 RepID=UPI0034D3A372
MSLWNLNGAAVLMEDEGTYTAQAFSVMEGELAPYTYRYEHPPLGWIQLGALAWLPHALGLGDGTYIGATRYAITPFFVATALLIYLIARRLDIYRPFAALSTVVFILSPLSLVFGRQVFLDNVGIPWLLLAFWMTMSPRAALWHHIWAGAFFALAVLSKETLAIFGPALLVALLNRPMWSNRRFSVVGLLAVGGVVISFYPLMAILSGELWARSDRVSLQDALAYHFMDRSGSGSIWDSESDRFDLLNGWLYYDEYLVGAGAVAGLICLAQRRTAWIMVAVASFTVPIVAGIGYLPGMYIIGVLPFLALAIGASLDLLWRWMEKHTIALGAPTRLWVQLTAALCIAAGLVLMAVPQWLEQNRMILTREANRDWASTLQWVANEIPPKDTVLVPAVMWKELHADKSSGTWTVVPTEKADLDPQFLIEHPQGADAIDWIVVGPHTRKSIDSLDLDMAGEALENSVPVRTIGDWSVHRVQNE